MMGAGGQKMLQNFLQGTWQTEYAKSNNIWIIYTYDINKNILAVLRTLLNVQKYNNNNNNKYEKLNSEETTSKAATTEFLSKIPNKNKISN